MTLQDVKVKRIIISPRFFLTLLAVAGPLLMSAPATALAQTTDLVQLQKQFHKQYAAIQKKFAEGPEKGRYPRPRDEEALRKIELDRREKIGRWQDELAARFAAAAATAEEIVSRAPQMWRSGRNIATRSCCIHNPSALPIPARSSARGGATTGAFI